MNQSTETITLGGGCFWCTEAIFEQVQGVVHVESGYCNGHLLGPTYEQVCTGTTGHNEVIRVVFDPAKISLSEVLEIFFAAHDPTTPNRQGNDIGTQYRSGIYVHQASQLAIAQAAIASANAQYHGTVATEIDTERNYVCAETYHQHYFASHPTQGYCAMVIAPKIEKLRKTFAHKVHPPRKGS
jgi:peptide-methionine (S)-S-oxide reductase